MPQMAPMNWMNLYFMFTYLFIMMIIMNYYMFLYKSKTSKNSVSMKIFNWKW